MLRLVLIVFFLWLANVSISAQNILESSKYDSIVRLRAFGEDKSISLDERFQFATRAVELSYETKVDSIILKSRRILSTIMVFQGKYEAYADINYKNLKTAKLIQDSLALGVANHNLGWYHQFNMRTDSAFYYYSKAIKIYNNIDEKSRQINALMNLSLILSTEKDYFTSEEYAIQAIKLIQYFPLDDSRLEDLWILYNRLGLISMALQHYDKALEYHEKALDVSGKMSNGISYKYTSIHNKASVFRKKGDYKTALNYYYEILEQKEVFLDDPTFYPLVLDNIAFTKFEAKETDYDDMEKLFKKAYRLSDSLEDEVTKLAVTIDLSKFYKDQNKIDSALNYAEESYKLAKELSSNEILLESMVVLSELKPGEEGKKYLNEHIKLSDSLLNHERAIRNKFARVQFETDQIELENERISTQRFWLLMVSAVLVVAIFLLYIIITQRAKNKELKFEREQQQTNEEIYNLMLSQQDKVDEARAQEKKRISEEMHDGILGRLFGTRLSLDSLNFSEGKEASQKRSLYIDDLKGIEQDIRQISHDLNTDFVAGSGFVDIIETLVLNQTQAYKLKYDFYHTDDINWENISNKAKIHIYRILQESLQNIYKHAQATHVKISFELKNDVIWYTISDDGKGYETNKSKKGIGLKNIHSRVNEVNGTVEVDSKPREGTTIMIQIPYLTY